MRDDEIVEEIGSELGKAHNSDPREIEPGDPAVLLIREALDRGLGRIREGEPRVSQGEVEGVHRLRTTTRRLRSELRLFRGLVDADWAERLGGELQWLAQGLGVVRDLDVLRGRLHDASGELSDALAPIFATLLERRDAAARSLQDMLGDERYRQIAHVLAEAVAHPDSIVTDRASEPCRSALMPRVADAWKSLKKAARRLHPSDPDEEFHRVRKLAKRAIHAAEAVTDILKPGDAKDAGRFLRRLTRVKDLLGEHQDAVVACQTVEQIAVEHPSEGPFNFAAGRLLERQARASDDARARFFGSWGRLDRKPLRRWLKA